MIGWKGDVNTKPLIFPNKGPFLEFFERSSSPHRAELLDPVFMELGIGLVLTPVLESVAALPAGHPTDLPVRFAFLASSHHSEYPFVQVLS